MFKRCPIPGRFHWSECPRGDLNPEVRAFSPILRLSTQMGEKSPVRGFHANMIAGLLQPVSSGLASCGPRAACAGAIPGVTALPALPAGVPGRLRQSACHPMGASQRSRLTMRVVAVWPESACDIRLIDWRSSAAFQTGAPEWMICALAQVDRSRGPGARI